MKTITEYIVFIATLALMAVILFVLCSCNSQQEPEPEIRPQGHHGLYILDGQGLTNAMP